MAGTPAGSPGPAQPTSDGGYAARDGTPPRRQVLVEPTSDGGSTAHDRPAASEGLGSRLGQEEEVQATRSPATISSESDTGSVPTRRDLSRVKRGLVRVSENLRAQLQQQHQQLQHNKEAIETALSRETHSRLTDRTSDLELRALQSPVLLRLLDERAEAISVGVRAGLSDLREELMNIIQPVQDNQALFREQLHELEATIALVGESATLAIETIGAQDGAAPQCTSDESEWSLLDQEEFQ